MKRLYPLHLAASCREKIWGAADLKPLFDDAAQRMTAGRRIGEIWFTFEQNAVTNGPFSGQTLASLMRSLGPALMGDGTRSRFPLLVKFLFTSDMLSVQVHPDDAYARKHERSFGKTEMWYVVRAEPGAKIAVGLTAPLEGDRLRQAAASGEIVKHLNWIEPQAGDAFFIPAGTVHSIGAGLVLCEIQQNSDVTYRFHDFARPGDHGRPRELHIERAVAVTRHGENAGKQQAIPFRENGLEGETLAACEYFVAQRLRCEGELEYRPDPERFHILAFVEGTGKLEGELYQKGDVYLIPAGMGPFHWQAESRTLALRAFDPRGSTEPRKTGG